MCAIQRKTYRQRQQYDVTRRQGAGGQQWVEGIKYRVMEKDLTLCGGHTMQYTNNGS